MQLGSMSVRRKVKALAAGLAAVTIAALGVAAASGPTVASGDADANRGSVERLADLAAEHRGHALQRERAQAHPGQRGRARAEVGVHLRATSRTRGSAASPRCPTASSTSAARTASSRPWTPKSGRRNGPRRERRHRHAPGRRDQPDPRRRRGDRRQGLLRRLDRPGLRAVQEDRQEAWITKRRPADCRHDQLPADRRQPAVHRRVHPRGRACAQDLDYACCHHRGQVVALDIRTGKRIWTTTPFRRPRRSARGPTARRSTPRPAAASGRARWPT